MPLITCEISLDMTWSANCVACEAARVTTFAMTDRKGNVRVVTLSTKENSKLFLQLNSDFKRTANRNQYQSKMSRPAQNRYFA